ncbi:MAG: nitroreductase family protein [Actinobacteria bacterium]|nr:nitroreductase family protein [Actinomycetota bacterium]
MEHRDVVRRRRMVRRYRTDPVDPAALERIVAAAGRGPTAGNAGGISLVAVTSQETRTALAGLAGEAGWVARGYQPWLSAAPVHLVLCVEPATYRSRYAEPDKDPAALAIPWWWVDGGAALLLILQAAVDEGLAAGFLGAHAVAGVADLLGIPKGVEVVGIVTIGHPLPEAPASSARRGRRPFGEFVHREHWGR